MPKESLWTYFRILIYANFNVIPPEDITLENYLWYIHLNGEKKKHYSLHENCVQPNSLCIRQPMKCAKAVKINGQKTYQFNTRGGVTETKCETLKVNVLSCSSLLSGLSSQ